MLKIYFPEPWDLLEFRPALVCNNVGSLELTLNLTLNLGILHYFIPERGETPGDPKFIAVVIVTTVGRIVTGVILTTVGLQA